MTPHCVETTGLDFHYRGVAVLHDIALAVPRGSIYGFLGPNGAGKTTTLRLLLGLLTPRRGRVALFGLDFAAHRLEVLERVGALIESPSIYEHLSARENLAVLQKVHRCPPQRIAEVLAQVGLADTGRKRCGQFSLGMKQRLAIAMALLHGPELLVLDEPTNGLDPAGIVETRELLKTLHREHGTTILVSSHLLAEIDKLVTHLGIIERGRLSFQGTLAAFKALQQQVLAIALRTGDDAQALQLLHQRGLAATRAGDHIQLPPLPDAEIAALTRELVQRCIAVHEIAPLRNDLETMFMDLVEARA